MKKTFSSLLEATDFYNSVLQKPLLKELSVCREAIESGMPDKEKARRLLMGGHQWRLNLHPEEVEEIIGELAEERLWTRTYSDFEAVYGAVEEKIGNCHYVGPLTVYDVAKRIGHCCGCEPKEQVYLQSGARTGARALLGVPRLYGHTRPVGEFADAFPGLSAMHIENILCIMKTIFVKGGVNPEQEIDFKKVRYRGCCIEWTGEGCC